MALADRQLLDALSRTPFVDSTELALILGEPHATVHLKRLEPAVDNEIAGPFVVPVHLYGRFQIDCPRVPQFSVTIASHP